MDNNGRFYWLKLKRDFFKRHDITIIESMPNGKDYILFYLKLLCESVDHEGNLRFSEQIPYNEDMLATLTHTNVDVVRSAIKVFTGLGMMEILDDGTYYLNEVQKMIGYAADNDNANRQRRYRERKKAVTLQDRYAHVTNSNESKIKSKSIELDNNICANDVRKSDDCASYECANAQDDTCAKYSDHFEEVWKLYPRKKDKGRAYKAYKARLASGWSEDELKRAVEGYASECKRKHTPEDYIKHPSTFFSADTPFTDYLKENKTSTNWGIDEDDPYGIKEG